MPRLDPRHGHDEQSCRKQEAERFERPGPQRPRQQRAVEDVLDELGVDFDAGKLFAARGGVLVEQRQSGHAEHRDLALEQPGLVASFEHIGGRNEPRGVVSREVYPGTAVGLRRHADVADFHVCETAFVRDAERRQRRGDPEALERECQHGLAAEIGDDGHAPYDAALGLGVDHAVTACGMVDERQTAQHARVAIERQRRADDAGSAGRSADDRLIGAGNAENDLSAAHRFCEKLVVGTQLRELGRSFGIAVAQTLCDALGRRAVGLGEQQIDGDRGGLARRDAVDEMSDDVARPGPLADARKTVVVHRDDDGGRRFAHPRQPYLVVIESVQTHRGERTRVGGQHDEGENRAEHDAEPAAAAAREPAPPRYRGGRRGAIDWRLHGIKA